MEMPTAKSEDYFSVSGILFGFLAYLCSLKMALFASSCDIMILDVVRHKFYEGLLVLLLATLVLSVMLLATDVPLCGGMAGSIAPLGASLAFVDTMPRLLGVPVIAVLYFASVLIAARATLRVSLYPVVTMAPIALFALVLLPAIVVESPMRQAIVALLFALSLSHMLRLFGPRASAVDLFGAMLAAGTMPLVDISLVAIPVAVALAIIAARATLREATIVVGGMLLPLFIYCYVEWCLGGSFGDTALAMWRDVAAAAAVSPLELITIPRLIFLGVVIFVQTMASIFYATEQDLNSSAARGVWRSAHLLLVVAIASIVALPSASASLIVVVTMISVVMQPLFFMRIGSIASIVAYVLLFGTSVVAII